MAAAVRCHSASPFPRRGRACWNICLGGGRRWWDVGQLLASPMPIAGGPTAGLTGRYGWRRLAGATQQQQRFVGRALRASYLGREMRGPELVWLCCRREKRRSRPSQLAAPSPQPLALLLRVRVPAPVLECQLLGRVAGAELYERRPTELRARRSCSRPPAVPDCLPAYRTTRCSLRRP